MFRFRWILLAVLSLWPLCAYAQPIISPPIVTPQQRATWDRLKAEGHPYYKQTCSEADKDTTTAERYGSRGRWSALAEMMACGTKYAQQAYDVTKRISQNWTPGSLGTGNEIREHGVEHIVTLTRVAPKLSVAQVAEWKGWLVSNADNAMNATLRLNDTDQVTGTLMYWATMDRAFGTDYLTRQKAIDARAAVLRFIGFAEGGGYPVLGDYEWGDLYLLFNGAEAAGIERFPEIAAFRESVARVLIHWSTPDLRDTFELGDDQSPNGVPAHLREDLSAYLGHHVPEVRTFEMEHRKVNNTPDGTPMYPRYFEWVNPFAPVRSWRDFAGLTLVNPNMGRFYHKTDWTPQGCGIVSYFPPLSNGLGSLDHIYGWFSHHRIRCADKWTRDSPIGYTGNNKLANQTVLAGLSASNEVGVMAPPQVLGPVVYLSGVNAGLNVNSAYYNPPATYRYELTPSLYWIPSWNVLVKIERIHVDDPKTQRVNATSTTLSLTRFSSTDQTRIKSSPLIRSYWHSQTTIPVIQGTSATVGEDVITPLYPATLSVEDMAANVATNASYYGTLAPREAKWILLVDPVDQTPGFRVLTTLRGDVTGTIENLPDVQKLRLRQLGKRDIIIYSSTKPSPVLTTSKSGAVSAYDRNKVNGILTARAVTPGDWADSTADVFIEQANGLVQLNPPPVPDPVPSRRDQLFKEIRERLDEVEKIGQ